MILGTVIGAERQWRASTAGLRTNALVCIGSTLFVLLSAEGPASTGFDPTRVAAQVVSGIGFLGAGVIMRQGVSVSGLNTAATLWCSAAIGTLSGLGFYIAALAGTMVIVFTNLLLPKVSMLMKRRVARRTSVAVEYNLAAECHPSVETQFRTALMDTVSRESIVLRSMRMHEHDHEERIIIEATVATGRESDALMGRVVSQLHMETGVLAVRWAKIPLSTHERSQLATGRPIAVARHGRHSRDKAAFAPAAATEN